MHPLAILLLILFFYALAREVRTEMKEQAKPKPPEPAPKIPEPPVINNTQTNHYHQTVNVIVVKEKPSE